MPTLQVPWPHTAPLLPPPSLPPPLPPHLCSAAGAPRRQRLQDSFVYSRHMLADMTFVRQLVEFPRDSITEEQIEVLAIEGEGGGGGGVPRVCPISLRLRDCRVRTRAPSLRSCREHPFFPST